MRKFLDSLVGAMHERETYMTVIGLILDIIGVVILFFNGPPISPILPDGSELILTHPENGKAKKARAKINLAKIALGFIIIGFVFQLIGSLIQYWR